MNRRPVLLLVVVVGVGLFAAALAILGLHFGMTALSDRAVGNSAAIRQLRADDARSRGAAAAARREAQAQRQLVLALQRQVRALGGTPLTAPPSPRTTDQPDASTGGHATERLRRAAPRSRAPSPARTAAPSSTSLPKSSRRPTPAPSPSVCLIPGLCLPGAGVP